MDSLFPPLKLRQPTLATRRREPSRRPPLEPEIIARRTEIARALQAQIEPISRELSTTSAEERRAIFFRLEHERPISLVGTDLKAISESTENFTLAIPKSDNLDKLSQKVATFAEAMPSQGHLPNEDLAVNLKQIHRGTFRDRLCEQFVRNYGHLIAQEWVICEIEILSLERGGNQSRRDLQQIRTRIETLFRNRTSGNFFEHEDIKNTCRAVIRCTGQVFQRLVEDPEWQVCISWFDARPEFETFSSTLRDFNVGSLGAITSPDQDAPVVCVIDSGVTGENPFLRPVTRTELHRSFLRNNPNPSDEHGHGSAVASLVSFYALNLAPGGVNAGKVWVANARILNERNEDDESDDDGRLFSKVLGEIVDTFVPLGVRIFNLSVGIKNRYWNLEARRTTPRRSWVARTIDRLSREKDVVFVISTGNLKCIEVGEYLESGKPYPEYLYEEGAELLDPAQAALALSVGSVAPSTMVHGPTGTAMAMVPLDHPSPFSRLGPGIRREVKPEVVELGGNYVIDQGGGIVRRNPGTDVMMASHQLTPALYHDAGTSFAAARVSHKIARVQEDLRNVGLTNPSSTLLKALLVNSAQHRISEDALKEFQDSTAEEHKARLKCAFGYGTPDGDRATDCDRHSIVAFYEGELPPNQVAFFDIPVPESLSGVRGTKRLTVTISFNPEVQKWGLQTYLGTLLKWRLFRGDIDRDTVIEAMSQESDEAGPESGAEEENGLPSELKGEIKVNLRSRGTIQHDVFEWMVHDPLYSEHHYTLAVTSYERWKRDNPDPVPYSVVVRLEDTTRSAQVYAEVQAELEAPVEVEVLS